MTKRPSTSRSPCTPWTWQATPAPPPPFAFSIPAPAAAAPSCPAAHCRRGRFHCCCFYSFAARESVDQGHGRRASCLHQRISRRCQVFERRALGPSALGQHRRRSSPKSTWPCADAARRQGCFTTPIAAAPMQARTTRTCSRPTASCAQLFDYIEVFYNQQRRHSAIDYVSRSEHEKTQRACPWQHNENVYRTGSSPLRCSWSGKRNIRSGARPWITTTARW